jgi:hypothetical protein
MLVLSMWPIFVQDHPYSKYKIGWNCKKTSYAIVPLKFQL